MAYILDSSSLITPFHQEQLASLALARGWTQDTARSKLEQFLEDGITSGLLRIATEVHDEVTRHGGSGASFLRSLHGRYKPLEPDGQTFEYVREVMQIVRDHYEPWYEEQFSRGADPYLLAYARQYGFALVTEERGHIPGLEQRIQGPPKLPFLAFVYKVRCIPLMTLLVEQGW